MISSLEIKNFRGHYHLRMENVSPITLITGMNNAGKSSLLEALFLIQAHSSPNVFSQLGGMRGAYNDNIIKLWELLFYQNDMSKNIQVSLLEDGDKKNLILNKSLDFLPISQQESQPAQFQPMQQILTPVKLPFLLQYNYTHNNYNEDGSFYLNNMGVSVKTITSKPNNEIEEMPWTLFMNPIVPRMDLELIEWFGSLELAGKKGDILEAVRMFAPEVIDIFSASQGGQIQLYTRTDDCVLPLKYAGDGVVRIVYLISAIMYKRNSLILIDEIENGLHYSMYSKMWELISKTAQNYNAQIIATTHSYECVNASVAGVRCDGREQDLTLHRLEKTGRETVDKVYDFEMTKLALNTNMEVR